KRRIELLLAKGQTAEAIALAKANNVVCDGAAFIAWDEVEKVPVSGPGREVYQPAMEAGFLQQGPGARQRRRDPEAYPERKRWAMFLKEAAPEKDIREEHPFEVPARGRTGPTVPRRGEESIDRSWRVASWRGRLLRAALFIPKLAL